MSNTILILTFSNLVASFKTLFTSVSSSFLLGFFSIFKYKFIWLKKIRNITTYPEFKGIHLQIFNNKVKWLHSSHDRMATTFLQASKCFASFLIFNNKYWLIVKYNVLWSKLDKKKHHLSKVCAISFSSFNNWLRFVQKVFILACRPYKV